MIARLLAHRAPLTTRLVCRDWKNVVTRHADPAAWCFRMWSKDAQWPRDERFAFLLPPSFLDVILVNEKVALDWGQFLQLGQHLIEPKQTSAIEEEEQLLWPRICAVAGSSEKLHLSFSDVGFGSSSWTSQAWLVRLMSTSQIP